MKCFALHFVQQIKNDKMLQPLQNEMKALLPVSLASAVEYCNTAILNIETITNFRAFSKSLMRI